MTSIFYIDGQFVPSTEAVVPANDLAVLRGYGVFDFLRTYGGKPFHLEAHLKRLERSASLVRLDLPLPLPRIRDVILETLDRNAFEEASVRIVVTGGTSEDNITPLGGARLLVMVTPRQPNPESWYQEGVRVITNFTERYLPEAKTINYIPAVVALQQAKEVGAIDALYVDKARRALEGTTTNLFAFFGDRLVTPGGSILKGITRQTVLELASDRFQVEITDVPLAELLRADEVFLTASNKEICPVRQIDDQVIGQGVPGPHTRFLMEKFAHLTTAYAHS